MCNSLFGCYYTSYIIAFIAELFEISDSGSFSSPHISNRSSRSGGLVWTSLFVCQSRNWMCCFTHGQKTRVLPLIFYTSKTDVIWFFMHSPPLSFILGRWLHIVPVVPYKFRHLLAKIGFISMPCQLVPWFQLTISHNAFTLLGCNDITQHAKQVVPRKQYILCQNW